MKLESIRIELLGQHEQLRATMRDVRALLARAARGEAVGGEVRQGLTRLEEQLRTHNLREEDLLRDVVPKLDAWGPARAEIMDEQHAAEHEALYGSLERLRAASPEKVGEELATLFGRLLAHMDREEGTFLGEDLLKDDAVVVEIGG
jgi:iron-sulfur cluster repair protein YtfE (RIC family)